MNNMEIILSSILNFIVVVGALWYFGREGAREFFRTRSSNIETSMGEAETLSVDAEKLLAQWETNWRECEAHAKQQFEEAKANVERFREKSATLAEAEAERIKREATLVGASEVSKSKHRLQEELARRSIYMAGQFLSKTLDDKDRRELVAEYVEIVGNGTAA